MTHRTTRRAILVAMGGTAALPLASASAFASSSTQEGCEELVALEAAVGDLRNRLAAAETDLDRLPDLIVERQRQILELHAAQSEPRFSSEVKAQARAVGLDARASVVVLDVEGPQSQGTATAWFVNDHHLLTNAHNVESEFETLYGITLDGETFETDLVGHVEGQQPDVALLRTEFTGVPLSTGDSRSLARDDPLVQVGHPGAEGFGFWAITLGGFQSRSPPNDVTATIPGLTGSSGSPILDLAGEVVAMTYGAAGQELDDFSPTDDEVRTGLLAGEPTTSAVPIETAVAHMEGWT